MRCGVNVLFPSAVFAGRLLFVKSYFFGPQINRSIAGRVTSSKNQARSTWNIFKNYFKKRKENSGCSVVVGEV